MLMQPSVGTGDPNPKGFLNNESIEITDLSVPLLSKVVTFTAEEKFGGNPLSALEFTLQCEPTGFASIIIPHDGRTWKDSNGNALTPGKTAPSIRLEDPGQQKLNSKIKRVFLEVQLELLQKGDMSVLFNMNVTGEPLDVTGEPQDIIKAKFPTVLALAIT
jgi:hypothetical protein